MSFTEIELMRGSEKRNVFVSTNTEYADHFSIAGNGSNLVGGKSHPIEELTRYMSDIRTKGWVVTYRSGIDNNGNHWRDRTTRELFESRRREKEKKI